MSENKNYSGQSVSDSDLLISGLQHFSFGRRQWALIHIESQWAENYLTVDGRLRHDNADDSYFTEKRGGSSDKPRGSGEIGSFGFAEAGRAGGKFHDARKYSLIFQRKLKAIPHNSRLAP